MTICVSVKVRDGLVLGTDSMAQIWGQDDTGNRGVVKAYSNARKLFQICDLPIGAMTYGIGNLGPRSMQGLIRDFSSRYEGERTVESVVKSLFDFFSGIYHEVFSDAPVPALGFYVAGYSEGQPFPEECEFLFPRDSEARQVRPQDEFGASWRGVDLPFTRLYKGYDPRAMNALCQETGASEKTVREIVDRYESPVVYDGMPVQDAINFAGFILQTTVGLASFELGAPSCGGPLQVAIVQPDSGFEWIKEPSLVAPVIVE